MPEQQPHSLVAEAEHSYETHQTPFYVLPTLEGNNLLTLPGGVLIRGKRNAVTSGERTANAIARQYGLTTKARGSIVVAETVNAYGYVVEPAWRSIVPEYADFTQAIDQKPHDYPLELHNYGELLAHIEAEIKTIEEAKAKGEQPPEPTQHTSLENLQKARHLDSVFVRALGNFILTHH
jgi:hypothetical protein